MVQKKPKPPDLREACLTEALSIIEQSGLEKLSLREVSRRLSVSHQAPYKHFPSRDHLLAEVIARAYAAFADHLEARPMTGDPRLDLTSMGLAYFDYARSHPLQYGLMFGTSLPEPSEHPNMMLKARYAFELLQEGIARQYPDPLSSAQRERIDADALFVWSTLHGLATIMHSPALTTINVSGKVLDQAIEATLMRTRLVLDAPE